MSSSKNPGNDCMQNTSWQFDNSAHSFGVINRTGSAGVYSAWLAGSNAGSVTNAYFSVGNGTSKTSVIVRTKLTYPSDTYRNRSFGASGDKSTIVLYNGTNEVTSAIEYK